MASVYIHSAAASEFLYNTRQRSVLHMQFYLPIGRI